MDACVCMWVIGEPPERFIGVTAEKDGLGAMRGSCPRYANSVSG